MRKLLAALTIAAGLVIVTPADAHTWGGDMWFGNGTQVCAGVAGCNNDGYVTAAEAERFTTVAMIWNEGSWPTYVHAYKRVNASAVWSVHLAAGPVVHSCLTDWDSGGPTAGYTVRCYAGMKA